MKLPSRFPKELTLRAAVGGKINGKVVEMRSIVNEDLQSSKFLRLRTTGENLYIDILPAHVLAQAIKNVFPTVRVTAIGPAYLPRRFLL